MHCYHGGVKSPRAATAGFLLLLVAVATAACGRISNPEGWSPPLFDDDTVYLFQDKDRLSAVTLDGAGGGAVQWTFPDHDLQAEKDIEVEAAYGEVILEGDTIYFAGYEGELYALSAVSGRLSWSTRASVDVSGSVVGGPVLAEGKLIFGTTEGKLYAVAAGDGGVAAGWPEGGVDVGRGIWASPVVLGDVVYVATMGGEVRAYAVADGSEVWAEPFATDRGAIPSLSLVGESTLFVATLGRRVYLVDAESGQQVGSTLTTTDWVWTEPTVRKGVAYFGDFGGHVYALDITTGTEKWSTRPLVGAKVKAGPAIVGDILVVADRGPTVYFVGLDDGAILNSVPIEGAGTVRADVIQEGEFAYVLTTKGRLFRANPGNRSVVEVPIGSSSQ
jgi:outer membrane protein assembly factor BamB